jgi:myo-inositol-hexaphosphate 3-phosphohydrolase
VNNVDVRYGVEFGDRTATIAVASNRTHESIDIFEIDDPTGMMSDIADGVQPPICLPPRPLSVSEPEGRQHLECSK